MGCEITTIIGININGNNNNGKGGVCAAGVLPSAVLFDRWWVVKLPVHGLLAVGQFAVKIWLG